MSTDQPATTATPSRAHGIFDRAKNILLTPQAEWTKIAGETTTLGALLTGYALPLAAIAVIAATFWPVLITSVFSLGLALIPSLIGLVIAVGVMMLGIFVLGLIVNALAPAFGSEKNAMRAYQLVTYSLTAAWAGMACGIVPFLGYLAMVAGGVYVWILMYFGLPVLMKTPEDKRIVYVLSVFGITVVGGWLIGMILAMTTMFGAFGLFMGLGGKHVMGY